MYISADRNPELNFQVNPLKNNSINPVFNTNINPIYNSSINPILNSSINPLYNSLYNPAINGIVNPNINTMINPMLNIMINPKYNNQLNPLLNATFQEKILFDLTLVPKQIVIQVMPNFIQLFDLNLTNTCFGIKHTNEGYLLFNLMNAYIGHLESNTYGGFNEFTNSNLWQGFIS